MTIKFKEVRISKKKLNNRAKHVKMSEIFFVTKEDV